MSICQWDFQKYEIGQVQYDDHKRLAIQFHDELAQDPMLTREKKLKSGEDTRVIIEWGSRIELPSLASGSYSFSSSISGKE